MVASPAPPDRPTKVAAASQRLIAGCRSRRLVLPRLAVFAGRDDRHRPALCNGCVTGAGVIGTISGHPFEGLVVGDLLQEVWQHGRVTDPAARDLDGQDFQRIGVDAEMHLPPCSWLGRPVFLGKPLTVPLGLDPGAVDQQVQSTRARAIGDQDGQMFLAAAQRADIRHGPIKPGQVQQACHHPGRLPQRQPKEHHQRQAGLDRSVGEDGRRPRLPVGLANLCVSESNQINSDPRLANATL